MATAHTRFNTIDRLVVRGEKIVEPNEIKTAMVDHWITEDVLGTFGCSVWKTIRRPWPQFQKIIQRKVGNGVKIEFWNELWIGERSLKSLFTARKAFLTHQVLAIHICSRCFMCDQDVEINSHPFLHGKTAANLWNMFLCMLGVSWVVPKTTKSMMDCWKEIGRRETEEDWWELIPASIWWTLWKERNARGLEDKSNNTKNQNELP
ncbi:hypothetical protein H5410_037014 [Solanum commersonii]|uniref:Uncharacterized protein n=1 Tax=Solanum commersonii TaxID=4109 RepID=A0A9J5Y9Y4_SOLCO|nr:hypothetical protein H5410_037014 [Solanum commersonii]